MKIRQSKKIFKEAQKVMVGGVNSPVRSFQSVGGNPVIVKSGRGSKIFDVDGNAYTDYCLSWGALILGHAHKDVISAVKKSIKKGISFGITTKPEIEIAKFIVKHVPSIDKVRFVNSGTEAAMSAARLARGFTAKNIVVKFDGCYHGHFDDFLIAAGSGAANLKESSSPGITRHHIQNTLSLPFNNVPVLAQTLKRHKKNIACVIVEPVPGNMGTVVPQKEFLQTLRSLTKKFNIVLIFDEVMSGFRTNLGCVQSDFGITPDLTCLGKIIGGGFPVGAYGGRADIMRYLAPEGGVYQAGTFSGNPVVMSAGLAALKNLNSALFKNLKKLSEGFVRDMNSTFAKENVSCYFDHYHSMMSIRFDQKSARNYAEAKKFSNKNRYSRLFHYLLGQGVYWPPAEMETFFLSGMHTQQDIARLKKVLTNFFLGEQHK